MLGDVEREAGLAHARPAGDDHQVAAVQAVADAVEIDEAGGHAGQQASRPLLELLERLVEDVGERHETALHRLLAEPLAEPEDRLLGVAQRLARVDAAVQAVAHDLAGRLDQPPPDRPLLDDLDVVVDAPDVG